MRFSELRKRLEQLEQQGGLAVATNPSTRDFTVPADSDAHAVTPELSVISAFDGQLFNVMALFEAETNGHPIRATVLVDGEPLIEGNGYVVAETGVAIGVGAYGPVYTCGGDSGGIGYQGNGVNGSTVPSDTAVALYFDFNYRWAEAIPVLLPEGLHTLAFGVFGNQRLVDLSDIGGPAASWDISVRNSRIGAGPVL